jgi:2-polyprenyl-3-methyl-5-hydroxy-6-metoxy-1,4-benzoquinol methylase
VRQTRVFDDVHDYYGQKYWLSHQTEDLGLPSIAERAKMDLAGRCIHWLRTLLRFLLPPARVLELGSAHGALVALLRAAGYDATGLELSPWVVEFARRTFRVPMLLGPVENQELENGSWDAVILNDLLEHLSNPMATLAHCAGLLKPEGLLVVQTPCYPDGQTHEKLQGGKVPFLEMMSPKVAAEHIYLFSQRSIRLLLEGHGFKEVQFERPPFIYDMYLIAARLPLQQHTDEEVAAALKTTPSGRLIEAHLEAARQIDELHAQRHAMSQELVLMRQCLADLDHVGAEAFFRFTRGLRRVCRTVPGVGQMATWLLRRSA